MEPTTRAHGALEQNIGGQLDELLSGLAELRALDPERARAATAVMRAILEGWEAGGLEGAQQVIAEYDERFEDEVPTVSEVRAWLASR